jgi:hypothetical protein
MSTCPSPRRFRRFCATSVRFALPDDQLTFLGTELTRLKADRDALRRAIDLTVHHPPVSFDATHGSSPTMAKDIDAVCSRVGVWPDAVLSGHAHLYQRFSRQVNGRTIPYVVSGSGGHLQHAPRAGVPKAPTDFGNYRLEVDPIFELGYLTLTVTMAGRGNPTLTGTFHSQAARPTRDGFVLDLKTGKLKAKGRRSPVVAHR